MSNRTTIVSLKFSLFLFVAIALTGMGIFLDGSVLDRPSAGGESASTSSARSPSQVQQRAEQTGPMVSELADEIQQAVERDKHKEMAQSTALAVRVEAARQSISDLRQVAERSGVVLSPNSAGERHRSINRDIESLKLRLAEME